MCELKVFICRNPGDYQGGEISIDEISDVRWDNISGGINKKQAGFSLYGYIDYRLAAKLVACSGAHDYGDNVAKICIPGTNSKNPDHKEGYKILSKRAGEKPKSNRSKPSGLPPCSKRILQILDQVESITRKELRNQLIEEGYHGNTIRNIINYLKRGNRIITHGFGTSPNQIIQRKA